MVVDASPWVVALSSDSEDDDIRPSRPKIKSGMVEQSFSIDEDGDVLVLNVSRPSEKFGNGAQMVAEVSHHPGALPPVEDGQEIFYFTATKDHLKQHDSLFEQRFPRQPKRVRDAFRLQENGGRLTAQVNLAREAETRKGGRGVPSAENGLGFIDMERLVTGSNTRDWYSSLRMCHGPELSNLHWNIVRFCQALELTAEQVETRNDAFEYVKLSVREIWPSAEVHLFGSTATGLALPSSDIDVAVLSPQSGSWQKPSTMSWLSALSRNLRRRGKCRSIRQIPFAKVPLLKVVFNSGLACDISFDVPNGIRGVPVIRQFMQRYQALRPLCLVLKFLLGLKNLNELYTGGIGSFCLINMIVNHLQNLGAIGSDHDLGMLLLTFLVHFSSMHNYLTDVVCTRPGYCTPKDARGWVNHNQPDLLSCEDPLDPTSDIAKGSYRIEEVRDFFSKAKSALLVHWHEVDVLSQLMGTQLHTIARKEESQVAADSIQAPGDTVGKKSKKRKKKTKQAAADGDDEDERARKMQKLNTKSIPQETVEQESEENGEVVDAGELFLTFSVPV
ncbi:hypothetical protein R1sor_024681 [Riccia sorocarpa]|uniref:Polymerase nucleotidyl transferase domain-containing protein n=1 Tax=Riccia sorocarpa TaxID=122646 RepID=A0ABD3GUC0_9MARC